MPPTTRAKSRSSGSGSGAGAGAGLAVQVLRGKLRAVLASEPSPELAGHIIRAMKDLGVYGDPPSVLVLQWDDGRLAAADAHDAKAAQLSAYPGGLLNNGMTTKEAILEVITQDGPTAKRGRDAVPGGGPVSGMVFKFKDYAHQLGRRHAIHDNLPYLLGRRQSVGVAAVAPVAVSVAFQKGERGEVVGAPLLDDFLVVS